MLFERRSDCKPTQFLGNGNVAVKKLAACQIFTENSTFNGLQ